MKTNLKIIEIKTNFTQRRTIDHNIWTRKSNTIPFNKMILSRNLFKAFAVKGRMNITYRDISLQKIRGIKEDKDQ